MSLKLASDNSHIKTAFNYKEIYPGFVPPADSYLEISKYASEKRELLKKLSALEKHVDAVLTNKPKDSKDRFIAEHKTKLKHSEGISESTIEELRKYSPAKLLKALADQGIIFSPEDFIKYVFGANKLGNASSLFDKVKSHLPSIFSKLDDDGDDVINNDKYEPSQVAGLPKELMSVVKNLFNDHSLFEGPAHNRIMRITIIKKTPNSEHKEKTQPSKEASVRELAEQYAAYKLAALRYLDEHNKLDEDIMLNALMQNR